MFSQPREPRISHIHSVFAQLAVVSIPSGASRFTCSPPTREKPQQKVPGGSSPAGHLRNQLSGSASSAASAPAAARGTATARGVSATAGMTTGVPGVPASAGRTTAPVTPRPPAATRAAAGGPPPHTAPARLRPVPGADQDRDEQHDQNDRNHHTDENTHRPHDLPSPEARSPASMRFLRVWGMPPPPNGQSRLEQLQSFCGGWQP